MGRTTMAHKLDYHISILSAQQIRDIAAPLFEQTQISYFSYGRFYNDGGIFFLNTHPDFMKCWFDNPSRWPATDYKDGMYKWEEFMTKEEIQIGRENNLGVDGIGIVKRYTDYVETMSFNCAPDKSISKYYLNSPEIFQRFGLYFKEKAADLINAASRSRIYLPEKSKIKTQINLNNTTQYVPNELVEPNVLYINNELKITLTDREKQCFNYLIKGYSTSEIATMFDISIKTVQTYIARIKAKFKVRTTSELFAVLWENGILKSAFI